MISFACKQVEFRELIMCSFGLTKGEYNLLMLLSVEHTIRQMAVAAKLDRSSAQKSISGLLEKGLVTRRQVNQEKGGYIFYYTAIAKPKLKARMEGALHAWSKAVQESIKAW
jgi:predicted transcriptional regulator